ncbi:hypothetical protein HBI04_058740 [Parastagonospora nodorum]|nr:hypothetical protein HBI03_051090 [Parastagonospora nodorum]KAH4280304.1 hypothetical protein HBI04_058740 [Parastagonospora nodorum]
MSVFKDLERRDFSAWVPILEAVAKPARHPQFHELTPDGEWKAWSSSPELPDEEPILVKQPDSTQVFRPVGDTRTCELEMYQGLHHESLEGNHIRLLDIQNARFEESLLQGFRLVTVPLADAPSFDALSYCWGDMRLCTGILLDTGTGPDFIERMFRVTEDLATCLVSILTTPNLEDRPQYLWIDQICINQEDIQERNEQVSRMSHIYETAKQVIVWLGQKSDFAVESAELPESPAADVEVGGQSLLSWILEHSLFARPWFFRLWTVQEVVLADRIQVLIGEECRPWRSVVEHSSALDRVVSGSMMHVEMNVLTRNLNWLIVGTISFCRDLMAKAGMVELQTFLPLIVSSQQCRDPRDKIYGLIGLEYKRPQRKVRRDPSPSERGNSEVYVEFRDFENRTDRGSRRLDVTFVQLKLPHDFVDYERPVESVFRDFARLMVESRHSLKYLTLYEADTTDWFPQFLPNSSMNAPGLSEHIPNNGQFAASAEREHIPSMPADLRYLDVRGRTVATVSRNIAEMPSSMKRFFWNPAEELDLPELCRLCWTHVASSYGMSAEDEWVSAFTRDMIDTIFCHQREFDGTAPVSVEGRSTAEVYTILHALFGLVDETEIAVEDYDKHALRVALSRKFLYGLSRQLVVLDTGHLALTQNGVEEGDKVAILHGLNVPAVIGEVEDGDGWQWLGDAFILGFMRGEVVDWEEDDADTFTLV